MLEDASLTTSVLLPNYASFRKAFSIILLLGFPLLWREWFFIFLFLCDFQGYKSTYALIYTALYKKDGSVPVMVSDTPCPAVQIWDTWKEAEERLEAWRGWELGVRRDLEPKGAGAPGRDETGGCSFIHKNIACHFRITYLLSYVFLDIVFLHSNVFWKPTWKLCKLGKKNKPGEISKIYKLCEV